MTEEFPVENGLRQGCTLAPTISNLCACLLVEQWSEKLEDKEGVGTYQQYQMDNKLFRRSSRSIQMNISQCCV